MFGIIFICVCIAVGKMWEEISEPILEPVLRRMKNPFWVQSVSWIFLGFLSVSWLVYVTASLFAKYRHPLRFGNGIMLPLLALAVLGWEWHQKKRGQKKKRTWIREKKLFQKECIFFLFVTVFAGWWMWYVFHSEGGSLYAGYTVFGDFSPHTAMIRSFSWGNNFPTQYPYFGGEDIKYHFMFQFLTGNLEYLGIPMEVGFSILGTMFFTAMVILVYSAAQWIFGVFSVGVCSVILLCFRSSFSFWRFVWEHLQKQDLWETLRTNTEFIGYTANENWGLWNLNVYLNQRHLAFGMCALGLALLLYLPDLEKACGGSQNGLSWLKTCWFYWESWKSRNWKRAVFAGVILGACVFWNGAVVIAALLILAGMGLFSRAKLDYALTAAIILAASALESSWFIDGKSMDFQLQFGFLADTATVWGVVKYLLALFGIFFPLLIIAAFVIDRFMRCLLLAFTLPLVFAFTVSLTPDLAVNHKYVMISMIFQGIFLAWILWRLWQKDMWRKTVAVLLTFMLTVTGVYDLVVIYKDNDAQHSFQIAKDDDVTLWLKENTDSQDLVLTPQYSFTRVTVSGVMMYCGWPYYAWSAGYPTDYRTAVALQIYQETDEEKLQELVNREDITYIIYEENMEINGEKCYEETIQNTYPLAYTSEDGTLRIYQTGEDA